MLRRVAPQDGDDADVEGGVDVQGPTEPARLHHRHRQPGRPAINILGRPPGFPQ